MITVNQITPAIGAEITGIDFSKPVSSDDNEQIYQALLDHCVIFFRDTNISPANHLAFAKTFGDLDEPHLLYPHVEGYENIVLLEYDADTPPDTNSWHTDLTFKNEQPFASILVSRQVPEIGGDTLWSSNYAAYDRLPEGMKQDLEALDAVHDLGDFRNNFSVSTKTKSAVEYLNYGIERFGSNIRPLIAMHPVTGRKFLNFNEAFTNHILGMTTNESNAMKTLLANHMNKPETQMRWRWRNSDMVMWDNRVTMHYAVSDYLPLRRSMNRITVVRDRREIQGSKAA